MTISTHKFNFLLIAMLTVGLLGESIAQETATEPVAPAVAAEAGETTPDAPALAVEPEVETVAEPVEEPADEATEEEAEEEELGEEEGIDFGGLVERAPAFFAVLHPALVHFPIALWLFGAMFVLIGVVAPSWGQQIPFACLVCGTLSAVAGSVTGWWFADENGYDGWPIDWQEIDWADGFFQHRWLGVALTIASVLLTLIALYAAKTESRFAGFTWRAGLLVLALGIGYEGHLGGAMIHSTTIEEAFVEWVSPEE